MTKTKNVDLEVSEVKNMDSSIESEVEMIRDFNLLKIVEDVSS